MSTLLFPGQGSQIVGMGSEFYSKFKIVKQIFNQADQKLNYSLSKIILEGSEDELTLTQNTQPAILTVSYSIFKVLKNEFDFDFNSFKFFSGHSLGEYTALVCAKSLEFEDAVATLTYFTALLISKNIKKNFDKDVEIILCGGGRKNLTLIKHLKKLLNYKIGLIDRFKINGDFIESQAFAYLSIRSYLKKLISFPSTTKVKTSVTGGEIKINY